MATAAMLKTIPNMPILSEFTDSMALCRAPGEVLDTLHDLASGVLPPVVVDAAAAGTDIVIAQGRDAGGHSGTTRGTMGFVPAVVNAVGTIPVVAAGGIADHQGWRLRGERHIKRLVLSSAQVMNPISGSD